MPFAGESACLGAAVLWAATVLLFRRPIRDHGPRTINLAKCLLAAVLQGATVVVLGQTGALLRAPGSELAFLAVSGLVGLTLGDTVTDRCDLRCSCCIPEGFKGFEEPEHWLNFDEIERLIGAFGRLGISRIRLTGGEPLLRRNITELSRRIAALPGIEDLSLSTNATQLDKHAHALKAAGVTRLNVSLDSLQQARVEQLNGRDVLAKVMAALAAAQDAGFAPIKLNMVALAGTNDDEIDQMVAFCMERGFVLRLIEAMPMGATGRNAEYLDLQPVKQRLRTQFNLIETTFPGAGPARYLGSADGRFNVGFITPISQHFCQTCNRIRISVDGTAYMCLGQDEKFEFRPLLRGGCSDAELDAAIIEAINLKPERHEFNKAPHKILRFMSMTGG